MSENATRSLLFSAAAVLTLAIVQTGLVLALGSPVEVVATPVEPPPERPAVLQAASFAHREDGARLEELVQRVDAALRRLDSPPERSAAVPTEAAVHAEADEDHREAILECQAMLRELLTRVRGEQPELLRLASERSPAINRQVIERIARLYAADQRDELLREFRFLAPWQVIERCGPPKSILPPDDGVIRWSYLDKSEGSCMFYFRNGYVTHVHAYFKTGR